MRHRCDVVVVGSGLAGLAAADLLTRHGADVRVLEAGQRLGGRVRGVPAGGGATVDTGAEFVGPRHSRLRALLAATGLRTVPSGLGRAPARWRLPERDRVSWLPPLPAGELRALARACWALRGQALGLDPGAPWRSPAAARLDGCDMAGWLTAHGVGPGGLAVAEAVLGGFATVPIRDLSAAHVAWWIAASGGLLAAVRSGQDQVITGGAYQLPRRLAGGLRHPVRLDCPVTDVVEHSRGVEVRAEGEVWAATAAIVTVPPPALRRLTIEPGPPADWSGAVRGLGFGRAVKIAAVASVPPPVPYRSVLGGGPLRIAWRRGRVLAGIATGGAATAEDLAGSFGLHVTDLAAVVTTDWTGERAIGGSYLACRPGDLVHRLPALRAASTRRIRFAGAEHSAFPNSMEGAVRSGQAAALACSESLTVTDPGHRGKETTS
ncbi:monoamine oxidase [Prauserella shujinwangii]|uniref:Monoamine oxidase n=1 Tax=Prauserella shujinwangii TaxID=1453103 RepID=A0A2T0LQA3_9PSEU|nr:NAD(P)/FAD-dependent oxidoreductase [Prauserella shujinwangii]PRX45442.1 monoamine oxidase [Prauserella shujinwangii]